MRKSASSDRQKARRGKTPSYEYKTIQEIHNSLDSKKPFNIYGVVIDSRPVEKSKGSDYFCILRIVDPTYYDGDGVKVTLFHFDENKLPQVDLWTIVRLHRVRANTYQGKLTIISSQGWSWMTWQGKPSDDSCVDDVGATTSKTSTVVDKDKERISSLQNWIATQGCLKVEAARNATVNGIHQKLKDVTSGCFFNLVCQVTGITEVRDDFIILSVWDGTIPSHKIEPAVYPNDVVPRVLSKLEGIEHYMVDVSIFDNHARTMDEQGIELGSFVRFCNLHASPKIHGYDGNSQSCTEQISELFLHKGIIFNRGVVTLEDDDDTVIELKITMRSILESLNKFESSSSDENKDQSDTKPGEKRKQPSKLNSPIPSKKRPNDAPFKNEDESPASENSLVFVTPPQTVRDLLSIKSKETIDAPSNNSVNQLSPVIENSQEKETDANFQSQDTLSLLVSMDIPAKKNGEERKESRSIGVQVGTTVLNSIDDSLLNKNSSDMEALNLENSIQVSEDVHEPDSLRCQQESATVVFGEDSPLRITTIQQLLHATVPSRKSKLFRIRVKVCRFSNPSSLVYHFCPVTGLRIPAKNDGERIRFSEEAFEHINVWRYCSGLDQDSGETESKMSIDHGDHVERVSDDNTTDTQLVIVPGEGSEKVQVRMETYEHAADGSTWQTLTDQQHSNISRKRKRNEERFRILYRDDPECTRNLADLSVSFHRIIRICPKEALTSREFPAVAFQNGIYYYCSPSCVKSVSVPTLAEEAVFFNPDKPTLALGCPVMPLIFCMKFLVEDNSFVMQVDLKGKHAISFFNDVTPEQYLRNTDGCHEAIADDLNKISSTSVENGLPEGPWVEMVIEKKLRRPMPGDEGPVAIYEVVNTKIAT